MRHTKKFLGALVCALALVTTSAGPVVADVSSSSSTPASCMGIEAAALSPPGSADEAPGGMPDVKAFLDENAPGVPPGLAFYSFAAQLREGSHAACDAALGG
jgi:hypothetical protein